MLLGPTYCDRLWCVMEIFTFLRMGGEISRVAITPIELFAVQASEREDVYKKVSAGECWG